MAGNGRRNANEALAVALAAGRTVSEAAESAGIAERTAYRRLADDDFLARVQELRGHMVEMASARLAALMAAAADRLGKLVVSKDERVALGACRATLELAVTLRQANDIEARLAALEQRQTQRPRVRYRA